MRGIMKRFVIIAMLSLIIWLGYAVTIPPSEAQEIGISVFTHLSGFRSEFVKSEAYFGSYAKEEADFYILRFEPTGFILVAADDSSIPILGYSLESEFPLGDIPAHVKWYLDQYSRGMTEIRENPQWQIDESWDALRAGDYSEYNYSRNVAPLLGTTWNQGDPYNYYCPADVNGPGGRVYAGCVATAMAQVMKKWNHPAIGVGSHSYTASGYGTQSANFGATTYNWANMPNSISTVNTSIATLIYHCGVAVDMDYSVDGSGAYASDARAALVNYFRYNSAAQYKNASSYSSTTWATMLRSDLDLGRPIFYRGQGGVGGHAFVLDGYQGTNSFHFNWGWSGYYNGYFSLTNLNPNGNTFNDYQGAIFNVYPVGQGNLTGTVSSGSTGLAGATVSVTGTSFSATTSASGGYTITGIPTGTHQVIASKTGYHSLSQSVTLEPGQTSTLSFTLTETGQVQGLNPPTNLQSSVVGDNVHLTWAAPAPPPAGQWITWCNPNDIGSSIGTNSAVTFAVAHRFDSADLMVYHGSSLTRVSFMPNETNCTYTIKVWTGGTATTPGSMVHSQVVTAPTIGGWNDVVLSTPVPVPATGNLWFGYEANTQGGHPAVCDAGPMVPGKGNIMYFNNGWTTLDQLNASLTYNWAIQGFVDYPQTLVGYKVYRLLAQDEANVNNWTTLTTNTISPIYYDDLAWASLSTDDYKWAVRAVYTGSLMSEAAFSNILNKPPTIPATVQNLQIAKSGSNVTLSWNAVSGSISGYRIYFCAEPGFTQNPILLATTTSNQTYYIDAAAGSRGKGFYRVIAFRN